MTQHEKQWLNATQALGCVVCRNAGWGPTPAEIHHKRQGPGAGQRASHYHSLPLCPPHHRSGGYGVALHAGQAYWEQLYGTENELLAQVHEELAEQGLFPPEVAA